MFTRTATRAALIALIAACFHATLAPVHAQTQAEMNQEALRDADKADAAMNAAYKKLMALMDAPEKRQLVKAQRAWLVYRDADAASLASLETGGTMYPMVYENCTQEITEARTRELTSMRKELTELNR